MINDKRQSTDYYFIECITCLKKFPKIECILHWFKILFTQVYLIGSLKKGHPLIDK